MEGFRFILYFNSQNHGKVSEHLVVSFDWHFWLCVLFVQTRSSTMHIIHNNQGLHTKK